MGRLFKPSQWREILLGAVFLLAAGALLRWPRECSQGVTEGMQVCGGVLIPSLFPFFVLSSLVVELGLSRHLGRLLQPVMGSLFHLGAPCSGALVLGWVGGYPVGARTAISLYQKGLCSRAEGEHLLAFCNNCGPAFALGVVGAGVFGSTAVGLLLYLSHLLASLLVGLVFRFLLPKKQPMTPHSAPAFQAVSFPLALTRSVTGAVQSLLHLCAFVLFFGVVVRWVTLSGMLESLSGALHLLGIPTPLTVPLLTGALEFSSGVLSLSQAGRSSAQVIAAAFLMGWGGLSVHCQVLALNDCQLSMTPYLWGKLLHGLLSAAVTAAGLSLLPLTAPCFPQTVAAPLAVPTMDGSGWVYLIVLLLLLGRRKKEVEKGGSMVYNRETTRHHRRI